MPPLQGFAWAGCWCQWCPSIETFQDERLGTYCNTLTRMVSQAKGVAGAVGGRSARGWGGCLAESSWGSGWWTTLGDRKGVYAESRVPGQLGLKERERGQQLAHGAHRWRPSDGRPRSLVKHLRWETWMSHSPLTSSGTCALGSHERRRDAAELAGHCHLHHRENAIASQRFLAQVPHVKYLSHDCTV